MSSTSARSRGFTFIKPFGCAQGKLPALRQGKRRAFTLIELLVVIAILSVLISILVPSLQRVRLLAHSVMCQGNLKHVHLAVMLYADENNNYAPPFKLLPTSLWWSHPDGFFVQDYLGREEGVLRCPSSGPPFEWTLDWQWVHPRSLYPSPNRWYEAERRDGAYYDYALTHEYSAPNMTPWDEWYYPPAPLHKHHGDVNPKLPGRLVGTSADRSHLVFDSRNADPTNFESSDDYAGGQEMKSPRHIDGETANVAYVDGHVAPFQPLVFSGWPATIPR